MSGLKMQDGSVLYSEAENNKMLATIAALREDVERLTKKLERSHLYRNSYYWQEKAMAVLRGEFTQCCSYCGWEAPPPNGWEELQKHIEECPEHPLPKLRARLEAAEAAVGILQKSTVSLLARAEQAEKELAAEREKVELARKLSDAVWEVHKKQSIWYDPKHPSITISIEQANAIFKARLELDNLLGGEK